MTEATDNPPTPDNSGSHWETVKPNYDKEKLASFIKHTTGLEAHETEKIKEKIKQVHQEVKAKYSLPPRPLRFQNPSEYLTLLGKRAKEIGVTILTTDQDPEFIEFQKKHAGSGAGFNKDKFSITTAPDGEYLEQSSGQNLQEKQHNAQVQKAGDVEHELIHAVQNKTNPDTPIEQQEYEAYIGANCSTTKLETDPEIVYDIFTHMLISINTWYRTENLPSPWLPQNKSD